MLLKRSNKPNAFKTIPKVTMNGGKLIFDATFYQKHTNKRTLILKYVECESEAGKIWIFEHFLNRHLKSFSSDSINYFGHDIHYYPEMPITANFVGIGKLKPSLRAARNGYLRGPLRTDIVMNFIN